jgi:mitogen-activated protein kinase kinase kinase 13
VWHYNRSWHCLTRLVPAADDHLINEAPRRQLLRLRKDELVDLYAAAGLTDDADALTKPEIVDAIIAARDDVAELPPSSPPGGGDENSTEYSSDDGNVAGGEETDFGGNKNRPGLVALRRRATVTDLGRINGRPPQNRSASMGHLQNGFSRSLRINGEVNSSGSYGTR